MKRPPNLLLSGCILYLLLEIWLLAREPSTTVAVRFMLTLILFFFVLRGSRTAGVIWGICNLLGALAAGYFAFALAKSSAVVAMLFALGALLTLANAAYLFFSSNVRSFQAKHMVAGT